MILKVSATLPPEAHVLDAASDEFPRASRVKHHIFDFIRHRVNDLLVDVHILCCVVHDHDNLEVVFG